MSALPGIDADRVVLAEAARDALRGCSGSVTMRPTDKE